MWEWRRRKSTLTYPSNPKGFWLATQNGEIIEENGVERKRN
jgi:hypothetical protein